MTRTGCWMLVGAVACLGVGVVRAERLVRGGGVVPLTARQNGTMNGASKVSMAAGPSRLLHATRSSATDLEIGGELVGVPKGQTRFVRWSELDALPQVTHDVTGDYNFKDTVRLTGIPLAELPGLLGAAPEAKMVLAECDDAYEAPYPEAYLKAHAPLLVLRVNGQPPDQWPIGTDGYPMGPYVISHVNYQPSFYVFKHKDEAQVPWGIVRLDFRDEAEVYRPILPPAWAREDAQVQQGYTIARQNCFRCHSREGEGGTKSALHWDDVARVAVRNPKLFDAYVVDPKKVNPKSQMAESPKYNAATLAVLRAYFATFVEAR